MAGKQPRRAGSAQLVKNLAILGAVALAGSLEAAEPKVLRPVTTRSVEAFLETEPGDVGNRSDGCAGLDSWGVLSAAGGSLVGDTTGMANDFERDYPAACSYGDGGIDEIREFTVDTGGLWSFWTCETTGWDTTLGIREEAGSGCPGDPLICDGDDCDDQSDWESHIRSVPLLAATTYYLVVDAYSSGISGPYQVDYAYLGPPCEAYPDPDAYCGDGVWCNGDETCNITTHLCEAGTPPCVPAQRCDEDADECIDPDPCLRYQNAPSNEYWTSLAGGTEDSWVGDDWNIQPCEAGVISYTVGVVGIYQPYHVRTALYDTEKKCIDTCYGGSLATRGGHCFTDADCLHDCCVGGFYDGECSSDTNCERTHCVGGFYDGHHCHDDTDCPGFCSTLGGPTPTWVLCQDDSDCPTGESCDGILPGTCVLEDNGTCQPVQGSCVYTGMPSPVELWAGAYATPAQAPIPGTECTFLGLPAGYYLEVSCVLDAAVDISTLTGVWQVTGFADTGGGAGMMLAAARPTIGYSVDMFAWTDGPDGSAPGEWFFGWHVGRQDLSNWDLATLCCEPIGVCCPEAGGCLTDVTEAECDATPGTFHPGNVVHQATCDDTDGDGIADLCDNCPGLPDADQTDTDGDGAGDPCDEDDDNDGKLDAADPAPLDPHVCEDLDDDGCDDCTVGIDGFGPLPDGDPANDGLDTNGDGICNEGDNDDDGDTVDDGDDADPLDPYVCQDIDADGCDDCAVEGTPNPGNDGPDNDGDGVCNATDNCVNDANAGQEDFDGDTVGDPCDNCVSEPNPGQENADDDAKGDACEECADDPDKFEPGSCGCNVPDVGDDDADGVLNCVDQCPGVDDAVFGPECPGAIPAVSFWGLVIMALLLLVAAKVQFPRRRTT